MTQGELLQEVEKVIEGRLSEKQPTPATWIVLAVLAAHQDIHGEDEPFYALCGEEHVRDTVRKAIQKYKVTPEGAPDQLILPGCERMQKRYLVDRDNDQVIVPVELMTDAELIAKEDELGSMAAGCLQHQKELRRYRLWRAEHQEA